MKEQWNGSAVDKAKMMEPLLTVGVINFNQGHFIDKCLDSIRSQDFQDFELFIIDDKSSDDSVQLIESYISQSGLKATLIVNAVNQGICKNLNQLLSIAKGKYFTFIAADDWGDSNRFSDMIEKLESATDEVCTVYSDAELVDETGNLMYPSYLQHFRPDLITPPVGDVFLQLLSYNFIPAMATISRTSAIRAVNGFDETLKFEDFDLWLKLAHEYEFLYTNRSKCYYRILENSLIRTLGARKWEDLFAIYAKYRHEDDDTNFVVDTMLNKCLENLYYTDSKKFKQLLSQFEEGSKPTPKVRILKLLAGIGMKGSVVKRFTNKLAGR